MKYALVAVAVVFALLLVVPGADAQITTFAVYPDGTQSFNVNLGFGFNALLFWDIPGDADLFIHTVNSSGGFVTVSLGPFPGIAFWLNFRGFSGPFLVFDVWRATTPGGGFSLVGQILL